MDAPALRWALLRCIFASFYTNSLCMVVWPGCVRRDHWLSPWNKLASGAALDLLDGNLGSDLLF